MKQNQFFELGLQKEMYMLNSGMLADKSIDGQIGFHLDFLRACKTFNTKCHKALLNQLELISRHRKKSKSFYAEPLIGLEKNFWRIL